MKPALTLHLLGPMRLFANGQDLEVPSRKARSLLAYLALRQDIAVPRETVCGLLWGDRGEEQARASLRQTLSALRKALGDQASFALVATHDSVTLHSNDISTDVGQLERAAKSQSTEELQAASELYRGDLLEGLSLDEPAFEQWVSGERERCRATAQKVLSRLVEVLQTERRIEDAISAATRLLSLDPLQENVHRRLMRLYVEQGRYDAALSQFEQCRKRLSETLGVQPEQETRDLAADVRSKRRQPAAEVQSPPTRSNMGQIEALSGQDDVLTYPERPSIAVLPFTNMSGDPEQEYFADGITEDIITELGRFREIFVIARNSSFAFKGKFVDAPEVGKMLGARYLLEGSVRRAGSRIRISAEMIEASTRAQIWADRYDRDLSDVFALQDEISRTIVVTMAGRLTEEHANHVSRKPTENLSAYDCVLRGQGYVHKYTSEAFDQARIYFEQAVSLDPGFARAFSWLAYIEAQGCLYWQMSTEGLDGAIQTGERAIALDQNDATGHMALGLARLFNREHDKAGYHLERAAAINPNDQLTMIETARYKMYTGDPHGGAHIIHVAMSQNPYHPNWYYNVLARCLHTAQDYAGAIAALERLDVLNFWCHAYLAGCYAEMGQTQKSADHAMQVLKLKPDFTLNKFARIFPYRDIDVSDAFFSGMRKAGLPE